MSAARRHRHGRPLFERERIQFGLRGDSYLWRELRAQFAGTPLPNDWFTLPTLIMDTIEQVVGEPLTNRESAPWDDNTAIYVPEFDPGRGISAGLVLVP